MIITYPNSVLRKKSKKVTTLNNDVLKTVKLLEKELTKSKIGVGLAAPQVNQVCQIFAIRRKVNCCRDGNCSCKDNICFYINPRIIDTFSEKKTYPQILKSDGEKEDFLEGCLSFPNFHGAVRRWLKIKVKYQTIGKTNKLVEKEEKLQDFCAVIFQHELDHLNGVLFVDHIKKDNGKLFKEEKGKLIKFSPKLI